jgi:2-polyprenyl-3-methyl-5-hydroxy-6-metoxy-1,4-benzoquinol methylase
MYNVDASSADFKRLLKGNWYYTVELQPGVFTRGAEHPNVILNRELLRRCTLSGREVCDLGTMEGVIPILAKRQGARSVVALDAVDLTEKIHLVQQCYGESFEYYPRISLSHVKDFLSERAKLSRYWGQPRVETGFDVVIVAGVLYHVFSPLHVIGLARTLLRQGGLLILETAASCQDRYTQDWVFQGDKWIYPSGTNTWFITLRLLDHFLRLFKLKAIDCIHLPIEDDITRVGVAAVAVDEPLPLKAESEWFLPSTTNLDYNEIVDVAWASGTVQGIAYSPGDNVSHSELSDVVDLHKTVKKRASISQHRDKIILHLGDKE